MRSRFGIGTKDFQHHLGPGCWRLRQIAGLSNLERQTVQMSMISDLSILLLCKVEALGAAILPFTPTVRDRNTWELCLLSVECLYCMTGSSTLCLMTVHGTYSQSGDFPTCCRASLSRYQEPIFMPVVLAVLAELSIAPGIGSGLPPQLQLKGNRPWIGGSRQSSRTGVLNISPSPWPMKLKHPHHM